jgi:hypothetical protein
VPSTPPISRCSRAAASASASSPHRFSSPQQVLHLAGEDDEGDAAGEAGDHGKGDELDGRAHPGQPEHRQEIVYGIVQKHGVDGLTIATLMAGVISHVGNFPTRRHAAAAAFPPPGKEVCGYSPPRAVTLGGAKGATVAAGEAPARAHDRCGASRGG